jgi:hypothetical protein
MSSTGQPKNEATINEESFAAVGGGAYGQSSSKNKFMMN